MRVVDKRIVHTLTTDCTWLLPSPNWVCFHSAFFAVCAPLYISCTVCFCVFLSLCFLQSHSHRITQHCAKGSSSTKAFFYYYHIIISLFLSVCLLLPLFNMPVFSLLPLFLSVSLPLSLSLCLWDICYISWLSYCVRLFVLPLCVWEQGQICGWRSEVAFGGEEF